MSASAKPICMYSFTQIVKLGIDKDKAKNQECFKLLDKLGVVWKKHAKTKECVIQLQNGRFQAIDTDKAGYVIGLKLVDAKVDMFSKVDEKILQALQMLVSVSQLVVLDGPPWTSHITDEDASGKLCFAFKPDNNLLGNDLEALFFEKLGPASRALISKMQYTFEGENLTKMKLKVSDLLSLEKALKVQINIAAHRVHWFILYLTIIIFSIL